jgi:hypothetical protein
VEIFRNDREHGIPLDLTEIGFLNGKSVYGLKKWFRSNYVAKIIKEIERDRPYNICDKTEERSDPNGNNSIL